MPWPYETLTYRMSEEFRETVIRQALLLGFEGSEYEPEVRPGVVTYKRWCFNHNGAQYGGYASCYSAALEFLRLIKFPEDKIGKVNG